tara:strand:+ start:3650 stop:4558 length:909 start_codon:yes stop_codon:yes gene_type:complete
MERKVIQLAGRTLVVSLPSAWARKYHVKKGDGVNVVERGKELHIGSQGVKEEGTVKLELNGDAAFIKRRVSVAYKRGFDTLEVSFSDEKTIRLVQEELQGLIGFEITHHGRHSATIKNVAETLDSEFDTMLRRVFLMLLELAEGSFSAIEAREYGKLGEIKLGEDTNDRFTSLCKRILNKKGFSEPKTGNLLYCIVWELEKIADGYEQICEVLEGKKKYGLKRETLDLYRDVNQFLRLFYELYYDFSEKKGSAFSAQYKELDRKGKVLLKGVEGDEVLVVHYLVDLVMRIHEVAGPYYGMVL